MNRFPRHRLLGLLFLLVAAVMLILGETVLRNQLGPLATLLYWTLCLLATCGAIMCALMDVLRSLRDSRRDQRALLEDALHEIEAERARRKK
jgi:hypothetical protein